MVEFIISDPGGIGGIKQWWTGPNQTGVESNWIDNTGDINWFHNNTSVTAWMTFPHTFTLGSYRAHYKVKDNQGNVSVEFTSAPIELVSATITSTPTITPTPNATCVCQPNGSCHSSCVFNGVASGQGNTIKCSFLPNEELSYLTAPSLELEKKSWCNRPARTTGDVTGNGKSVLGYMYYVQAINGGSIPALVNPDANGSGYLSPADGILIKP